MSSDSDTRSLVTDGASIPSLATVATGAKEVRKLTQPTLQQYNIEGLRDGDARTVIKSQLEAKWHTHNKSTLPEILRQAQSLCGDDGAPVVMNALEEQKAKMSEAEKEMEALLKYLYSTVFVRRDLDWVGASEEIAARTNEFKINYERYVKVAAEEFKNLEGMVKVLALPMRALRRAIEAFSLPDSSDDHVTRVMQIALNVQEVQDRCDAIIEITHGSENDEIRLSALSAVDPTWQELLHVHLWVIRQLEEQKTQAVTLQAIMDGTAYMPAIVPVPVPSGPNVGINLPTLKDMYKNLRNLQDICARGSRAYEELSSSLRKHVDIIRLFERCWTAHPEQHDGYQLLLAGVLHKSFLQVVDPVRFIADVAYRRLVLQAEQQAIASL